MPKALSTTGFGLIAAFVIMVLVFASIRGDVFSRWSTWQAILEQSAIPILVAVGLTMVLIVGEFDLSVGAVLGLGMGVAVSLMSLGGVPWLVAMGIAVLISALIGLINGLLVTFARVNSFIATLAMGSIVGGVEARFTDQQTLSTNIPPEYRAFGAAYIGPMSLIFWIVIGIVVVLFIVARQTETGRYLYAIGSNAEAARLAGVKVRSLRLFGFVCAAATAGVAGTLLGAQASGYYPNAGPGYLLPAFAAAFLGTAIGGGRFGVLATFFGVIFLQTLTTGLTVLNVAPWIVLVTQGAVLIAAVVLAGSSSTLRRSFRFAKKSRT